MRLFFAWCQWLWSHCGTDRISPVLLSCFSYFKRNSRPAQLGCRIVCLTVRPTILLACVWTIDVWAVVHCSCYLILFLLYWLQRLDYLLALSIHWTTSVYKKYFIPSAISVLNSRALNMFALWVSRLSFTHPVIVLIRWIFKLLFLIHWQNNPVYFRFMIF